MSEVTIRPEAPADDQAIRDLIVEVFGEAFGSGEEEAGLVEQLRLQDGYHPDLSLVATCGDRIVGHVFFSLATLRDFPQTKAAVLAPVGVQLEHQRQGIGSRLIREGLDRCRKHGCRLVFVVGDADYYTRFGFVPTQTQDLRTPFNTPHDMVMELEPGALDQVSGEVAFAAPFDALKEE